MTPFSFDTDHLTRSNSIGGFRVSEPNGNEASEPALSWAILNRVNLRWADVAYHRGISDPPPQAASRNRTTTPNGEQYVF
jgi:hypothetical protein